MEHMDGIIASIAFFSIPITAMITYHLRKMAEIKARMGNNSDSVAKELAALRKEVAELRDTTTRFDVSFDAAITRLEQRMDRAEEELFEETPPLTARIPAQPEREERTVQLRR